MLQRKAMERFKFWKQNKTRQALLVTGARQVGKTFLLKQFLSESYESAAIFDLVEQASVRTSFAAAQDGRDLFLRISLAAEVELVPRKTAIFIDEIQECPDAVTLVKYLVDDGRFDIVISGSLLGTKLEGIRSLPVGYVTEVEMYPLDFEEFCWARGLSKEAFPLLRACFENLEPVPGYLHDRMLSLFHRYLLVGGMPDAVVAFNETGTIDQVRTAQRDIIKLYKLDISKYAPKANRLVIQEIYDLIPSHLQRRDNRRFKIASIANVKRFSNVEDEFLWLTNAGVAVASYQVAEPTRPLLLTRENNRFKLFYNDVGLLTSTFLKQTTLDLLDGKTGMNMGGVYENAVAEELVARGFDLYYYSARKIGELDFVIEDAEGSVAIIEVKSGSEYRTHRALSNAQAVWNWQISAAYVLGETNIERINQVVYLPVYMACMFDPAVSLAR